MTVSNFQQQAILTAKIFRLGNELQACHNLLYCLAILEQSHKAILNSAQMQ